MTGRNGVGASERTAPSRSSRRPKAAVIGRTALVLLLALFPCPRAEAQDQPREDAGILVTPGDGTLEPGAMVPFEAEYEQMGFPFHARLVKTGGTRPVFSFQMVMEGPNGVGIDHVGHYADDLSFAYRNFGYGAFRDEYLEVTADEKSLVILRMDRTTAPNPAPARSAVGISGPVLDGTFLYWVLGALPWHGEAPAAGWRFPTWAPTAEGAEVRESPAFRVQRREVVELADGSSFEASVIEAVGQAGTFRMWVVDRPPYLLRQQHLAPDGTATEVIRLKGLAVSPPPGVP